LILHTIIRSKEADEDLFDIWRYIAFDNPAAADRVLDTIERRWQPLAIHPLLGRDRADIAPGIRHLVSGNYLILYRIVHDHSIEIVRVLHGRRRIDRSAIS
jgi:toxin ParE1/3/4